MDKNGGASGHGGSAYNGPDQQLGSPVPRWFRDWEYLTARGTSATSWDFQ